MKAIFIISIVLLTTALSGCGAKKEGADIGAGASASGTDVQSNASSSIAITAAVSPVKSFSVYSDYNATEPFSAAPPVAENWSVFNSTQLETHVAANVGTSKYSSLLAKWDALKLAYPNGSIPSSQTVAPELNALFTINLNLPGPNIVNVSIPLWVAFAQTAFIASPTGVAYFGLVSFDALKNYNGLYGLKISGATPTILAIGGKDAITSAFNRAPFRFVMNPYVDQTKPFGTNVAAMATAEKQFRMIPMNPSLLASITSAMTSIKTSNACTTTTYAKPSVGYTACKVTVPALTKITNKFVLLGYQDISGKVLRLYGMNSLTGGSLVKIDLANSVVKSQMVAALPWLTF